MSDTCEKHLVDYYGTCDKCEIERLRAALEEIAFGLPEPQSLSKCREISSKALNPDD